MSVLQEMQNLGGKILIDGALISSNSTETAPVIDPATESIITEIAETSGAEIVGAVTQGHIAQKIWWRKSALERAEIMYEIANELHGIKARLAEALTREMSKLLLASRRIS